MEPLIRFPSFIRLRNTVLILLLVSLAYHSFMMFRNGVPLFRDFHRERQHDAPGKLGVPPVLHGFHGVPEGLSVCISGRCMGRQHDLGIFFGRPICSLFGADAETLEYTLFYLPQYAWAFVVVGLNTMISAYLYSLVFNTLIIRGLPALVGESIIWYTYGIAEGTVLVLAVILLKISERNGIVFKEPQY